MLEKYLNKLLKNKNYSFHLMKIDYIKENEKFYMVYFRGRVISYGNSSVYKIDKKTGKNEPVFLPDEDNFKLLNEFESCDFVQIPEKYRNVYF